MLGGKGYIQQYLSSFLLRIVGDRDCCLHLVWSAMYVSSVIQPRIELKLSPCITPSM